MLKLNSPRARRAVTDKQEKIKVTGRMLRIGILLLIIVSVALFVPKKVRDTLGILGILGILAALWAIGVLAVVLINVPAPQ
jgi:hypothetical protein